LPDAHVLTGAYAVGRTGWLRGSAGGLDLGAEDAGYVVAAAVERDRNAAAPMEKNFRHLHSPVIQDDILGVPTRRLLRAAGLKGRARPDLLIGGPPCTPFSKSGFWLEWKRAGLDPDASLLQAYTRVLAESRPRAFVLENVYALTYNNKASRPAYERLLREIDAAGYDWRAKVLNAADYGVPQSRPRLFVIGVPKGEKLPDHPEATHGGNWERRHSGHADRPHVTAGESVDGLVTDPEPGELLRGQYAHLLPEVPPGANIGPFHWENRRLRVAEVKRLFTFPDSFEFVGGRASVQAQLGNSVPPLLACRVVQCVAASAG
jgi:DNA (cytosine-5)-methyltransferase 1